MPPLKKGVFANKDVVTGLCAFEQLKKGKDSFFGGFTHRSLRSFSAYEQKNGGGAGLAFATNRPANLVCSSLYAE